MLRMLVALLVLFGLIFGFITAKKVFVGKAMASYVRPPVTVSAEPARQESWGRTVSAVGTLQAEQGADLSAEVKGVVRSIYFKAGDTLPVGSMLIELDDRVEQANLRSFEAQLQLATITYERDKRLLQSRAISKTDFDTMEARFKDAQAQVERTRAIIDKMHLRAPFDGRVGVPLVKVGQYVSDGDPLVTFQSSDALYLEFFLPERYFHELRLGEPVVFTTDSYPDRKFPAEITAINVKVDDNTRSILVRATVRPFEGELLPGMFANIDVVLEENVPVVTVPQTAITYNLYGNSVFVLNEAPGSGQGRYTVERKYVQPGVRKDGRVAINSGLVAGEQVVVAGQIKLSNGSIVVIDNTVDLKGQ